MQLEYQGFAAARAHDGKHRSALVQKFQGAKLRIVEMPFPQKRLDKRLSKKDGVTLRNLGPLATALLRLGIRGCNPGGETRAKMGFFSGIDKLAHIRDFLVIQASLQGATRRNRLERRQDSLDRPAPTPFVYLKLKHRIDHRMAGKQAVDVGTMEHDAAERIATIA